MIMKNKITWAAVSPLIGGHPIGFENALGGESPPEYAINLPGFWANDSLYIDYLKSRNIEIPYMVMDENLSFDKTPKVDAVVATCVCAGLSMLNTSKSKDTGGADAKQNDHMYTTSRYVLSTIRPRVLVGESAPTLFTNRGRKVAERLKDIAEEFGYSYSMYKTSTHLHGIPQARHRTFYFMWDSKTVPMLEWYDEPRLNLKEFLADIPKDLLHSDDVINPKLKDEARWRFVKTKTDDARAAIIKNGVTAQQWIDRNGFLDEFIEWCKTNASSKDLHRAEHAKMKYAKGMGIWDGSAHIFDEVANAMVSRNMTDSMHPTEERSFTIREVMRLMGMPDDFELVGGMKNINKLAQNVPSCTAKSMAEQVVKFLKNELPMTQYTSLKQDNERKTVEEFDTGKILQRAKSVVKLDQPSLEEFV